MKKMEIFVFCVAMAVAQCLCAHQQVADATSQSADGKTIVILYENDVHCGIDGYQRMQGLYDAILKADTCDVGMVCCGDFLQGALAGAISHGQYIIDIMRQMSYDALTLGNHEFDYGVPRMRELLADLDVPVTAANFFAVGEDAPMFLPYLIKRYGNRSVAFVGVTTPESMRSEAYAFFDNDGKKLYDLCADDTYRLVQQAVDKARAEGADYVVVLSHLGEEIRSTGIWSHGLVENTHGIDVVLDGHTHARIERDSVVNNIGLQVPLTQTGTQFATVGKLTITPDGRMLTELIPIDNIPYVSERVALTTDSVKALIDQVSSRHIAKSPYDLPVKDADGSWIVRRSTAAIGDMVADAYRAETGAEIGLVNGGSLRNGLPKGKINYGDIISVQPFDNHVCLIEATGEQLLGMLQKCTEKCPKADGSFPHVAGMRYTIDTATHTVSNVEVEEGHTGRYKPLEPTRRYTVGTNDYYSSGGFYSTLKECRLIEGSTKLSRDMLADYLKHRLKGKLGKRYAKPQGRVTVN